MTLMIAGAAGFCAPARAGDWQSSRVWVTASDEHVWVVAPSADPEDGLPIVQMWHAGVEDGRPATPKQSRFLPAILGEPALVGSNVETLRILFDDLTVYDYFADHKSVPGIGWQTQSTQKPLAWGGDTSDTVFWVLAHTQALRPLTTRQAESQPTKPGKQTDRPRSVTLLELRSGSWQRFGGPPDAPEDAEFWLSARKGDVFLFWSDGTGGITCCRRIRGDWTAPERIAPEQAVLCGWAGAVSEGPIFVAGVSDGDHEAQLVVYQSEESGWTAEVVREGNEPLRVDPDKVGIGMARGRLMVARPTKDGGVEFGVGDIGVSPDIRFTRLSLRSETNGAQTGWTDLIALALMLGLMTVVFWSRREQMVRPIALPAGIVLAAIWRRALATVLDFLPGVILSLPLMSLLAPDLTRFSQPMAFSDLQEQMADPELQAQILRVSWTCIVLYGLWCFVWELAMSSTPGKLLLGCRVVSAKSGRPTPAQFLIRNLMRMVVLGLGHAGLIVTLMTMVVATRNRQRLGDLLAHTLVVETRSSPSADPRGGSPSEPGL